MRTALPTAGRPTLAREKSSSPREMDWLLGSPRPAERPPSIRDAIIRWLNEEL